MASAGVLKKEIIMYSLMAQCLSERVVRLGSRSKLLCLSSCWGARPPAPPHGMTEVRVSAGFRSWMCLRPEPRAAPSKPAECGSAAGRHSPAAARASSVITVASPSTLPGGASGAPHSPLDIIWTFPPLCPCLGCLPTSGQPPSFLSSPETLLGDAAPRRGVLLVPASADVPWRDPFLLPWCFPYSGPQLCF